MNGVNFSRGIIMVETCENLIRDYVYVIWQKVKVCEQTRKYTKHYLFEYKVFCLWIEYFLNRKKVDAIYSDYICYQSEQICTKEFRQPRRVDDGKYIGVLSSDII